MSVNNQLEKEIREAISYLKIEKKVKIITGKEKNKILLKLQKIFVSGNPRVWWLSLKYRPVSFVFKQEKPYEKIVNFFDETEDVWFIVEDTDQLLYKLKVSDVIDIIANCSYFEYNIISETYDKFLCETDHNEFLYIDISRGSYRVSD